jgi:hypothetical protein
LCPKPLEPLPLDGKFILLFGCIVALRSDCAQDEHLSFCVAPLTLRSGLRQRGCVFSPSLPRPNPSARLFFEKRRASGTDGANFFRAYGALCMDSPGDHRRLWLFESSAAYLSTLGSVSHSTAHFPSGAFAYQTRQSGPCAHDARSEKRSKIQTSEKSQAPRMTKGGMWGELPVAAFLSIDIFGMFRLRAATARAALRST